MPEAHRYLALFALIYCVAAAPGQAAGGLLAYMGPHVGDELERFIAEKAKPTVATADAGETAKSVVRRLCGHVSDVLLNQARRLNPNVEPLFVNGSPSLPAGTQISVPACPYWEEGPIPYLAKASDTLESIAENTIGHSGSRTTTAIKDETKRASPNLANTNLDRNLRGGDTLFLPYVSRPVRLQPIEGMSIDEFLTELRKKSAATRTNGKAYAFEDRFEFVAEAGPAISSSTCDGTASGYPLSEAEISRVMGLNAWHASNFKRSPYGQEPVVILVVDDGIQGSDAVELGDASSYPKSIPMAFAHTYSPSESSNIDNTFGQRYDEFSSERMAPTISYLPVPHNDGMLHGTHVTGILLGGGFAPTLQELFKGHFKVAHRNVVSRIEGAKIWKFNPAYTALAIRDLDNIERTSRERVIINLSAGGISEIRNIDTTLNLESALLVTAAGNESTDLDQSRFVNMYPANYGGEHTTNVISVAASSAARGLIAESNYGRTSVDIAAPGCNIVSNVGGQAEKLESLTGTSVAAPFVTMTAALLANYGIQLDDIKRRLWKTVDAGNTEIAAKIASGGELNIERALALGFDTITTKDGALLIGAMRQQVFNLCGESPANARSPALLEDFGPEGFERLDIAMGAECENANASVCVRMVLPYKGDADRHDLRRLRSAARQCRIPEGAIDAQTIKFIALDWDPSAKSVSSVEKDIPLASVRTIVPAEPSGSTLHPYRNAIVDLYDRR